jgi:hypothetical protein
VPQKKMLDLAKAKLDKNDWKGALEIANKTPEAPEIKVELQDLINLSQAQSHAEKGNVSELETAISLLQSIKSESPMSKRSLQLMSNWQIEIQDLAALQRARSFASTGVVTDLKAAITEAQQIPATNPRGKEAAQVVSEWRKQIETIEDTPYLNAADTLAATATPTAMQNAIAKLNSIRPGRALYPQAQEKIKQWTADLQRAEDGPILEQADSFANSGDLNAAVATASQIRSGRALSAQAKEKIGDWQAQLQATANIAAAQRLANTGTPEALLGAIQAAARVPKSSPLRAQARSAMDNWSSQMLEIAQSTASNDLRRAIAIAKAIPSNTSTYGSAQTAVQQWEQQLNPGATPNSTQPPVDNGNGLLN